MTSSAPAGVVRTFHRSIPRALVGSLTLATILSIAALLIVPRMMPITMDRPARAGVGIAVAALLVVVVLVVTFWVRNPRVVVTPQTVEVRRASGTTVYDRASTRFRTQVVKQSTNGIPTGTTRSILIDQATGVTTVELPGFTKRTFSEMMALINPLGVAVQAPFPGARPPLASPSGSFTLNTAALRASVARLTTVAVIFGLITLALSVFVVVPEFRESELLLLLMFALLTVIVAVGFGVGASQRRRRLRRTPERVDVSSLGIRIDAVDHPFSGLSRIWVTPAGYAEKHMRLVSAQGRKTTVQLASDKIEMTPPYEQFLATVQDATAHMPGIVSLDLE